MDSAADFRENLKNAPIVRVTDSSGKSTLLTRAQFEQTGLDSIPATGPKVAYKVDDKYTYDSTYEGLLDPVSITLDTNTGNIKISAPKSITDSTLFKEVFDEDTLKSYSQAYKLNPEYRVSITEKNDETGENEEREISIPDYIERLNSALQNYMSNLSTLREYKRQLVSKYGDKANNMTDEQAQMSLRYNGDSIYLPDSIFSVSSYGNAKNPFKALRDKRNANGMVSVEELNKIYTRDNIGRDEMAALLAHIKGTLEGSTWDTEDSYVDSDGNVQKNSNSATEAAKLLAFQNYILANNPHSEWWQQMGDTIESFTANVAYGVTKIFANLANLGETIITAGNGTIMQEATTSMDEAMEYFNTNNALVWDGVANAQILGTLGGYALGTIATGYLGKAAASAIGKLSSGLTVKLGAESAAALGLGEESAAATANSVDTIAKTANALYQMAKASEDIATGTKIMLASLNMAQKVTLYTNVAITGISGVASKNIVTEYLFDTLHDAIIYDFNSLRGVMIELAKNTNDANSSAALEYWGNQFRENAMWWAPVSIIRATKAVAGKTALGKAANTVLTKYLSKWRSTVGTTVQEWQDNLAGGSVIAKLQKQLEAIADKESPKADRIKNKIAIEETNALLRQSLGDLGDVKLEWDGVKLTTESAEEFNKFLMQVKSYENAIDARVRGVEAVERQMDGLVKDPSTGKLSYINPTLGGASALAQSSYYKIADLARKNGLKATEETLWSVDMVKYFNAKQQYKIEKAIASSGGEEAVAAESAAKQLAENVELAKNRLPEEITDALDKLLEDKVYQNWYKANNEYGVAHKLLDENLIKGYEANPIWAENGYMPTIVKKDLQGRWVDNSGRVDNIIEQEMQHYTHHVEPDQEYIDPELVRLTRRRTTASAEVSRQFWDAYNITGSSATNVTKISGEETEYAIRLKEMMGNLKTQVASQSVAAFEQKNLYEIVKTKSRKPVKNEVLPEKTVDKIVTALSPNEISRIIKSGLTKH